MAKVDIAAETQALPLGYYLSAPLTAAIEAQALSAHSTVEFINTVGTDDSGKVRTMEFTWLCCTNRLTARVSSSPEGLIPRLL